jgi:hypothetical protein
MPAIVQKEKIINEGPLDKLPDTKNKNGYQYTLITRNNNVAMYSMKNTKEPTDNSIGYEVFQISITKPVSLQQRSG